MAVSMCVDRKSLAFLFLLYGVHYARVAPTHKFRWISRSVCMCVCVCVIASRVVCIVS